MQENDTKKQATDFLKGLRKHLDARVPLQRAEQWICEKGKAAKEELFVEELVLKEIPEYLKLNLPSPTDEQVRKAFLTESRKARDRGWASMSPASVKKYLFTKAGVNPSQIVKLWWDKEHRQGQTTQSCPDWAFCFPHKVVFEAKLFRSRGVDRARMELVNGIYQCFYYRAHPLTPEDKKHPKHAAWDYDYACLFAYDVSPNQDLVNAWAELNQKVKDACWDSANIFVMVLPVAKSEA
jgi:hypothetical protein